MSNEAIEIFTDGACSGNPGPGGWGVILRYKGVEKELSGFQSKATNNQMELKAVIEALKVIKRKKLIKLYTDSKYVMQGLAQWIQNWKRNEWKTAAKKIVKNVELWQELDQLASQFEIEYYWIKGHAGHLENERADALARKAIEDHSSENVLI